LIKELKILFINYHNNKKHLITDFLNMGFYSVDITYNFIDTLNILNVNKYDFIFSDFSSDDVKILELLERKHKNCINTTIILITEKKNNLLLNKILNTIGNYEIISSPICIEKISTLLNKFNNLG